MIVATSVLKALQFMHSHRILHCDVRLRHILLTDNGGVKLCGFGSTRSYPYLGGETGRLQYQAPELIRWNWTPEAYGPKVDIWAFGITMIGKFKLQLKICKCILKCPNV